MPRRRASTSPAYRLQRTPRLRYFALATIPGVKRSPARLVIALSVAAVLAIFILYTSIAGAGTPEIGPSTVGRHAGEDVLLVGTVVGHVGDAHAGGMRFLLKDDHGTSPERTSVLYSGSVPDLFR